MDEKVRQLAAELVHDAPPEWERIDAVFALTVSDGVAYVSHVTGDGVVRREPSVTAMRLACEHRASMAETGQEPWLRMALSLAPRSEPEVVFDDGSEPFEHPDLLSPHAYRSDFMRHPRRRLPLWLAAYTRADEQQNRPPDWAARTARDYEMDNVRPALSMNDFPPLPAMWARWATLSAAFAGSRSELGPRMLPAVGWFEGTARSGSTVFQLPGGRAVLSGGRWDAPELADGYNGVTPMPDYYRGAPFWVANPVLNTRADDGMLSFCYWWDGGCWYRGESPEAAQCAAALPGIWTTEVVVELVADRLGGGRDDKLRAATRRLLEAAEEGAVTRALLAQVIDDELGLDFDAAWYQFFLAGLTEWDAPEVTEDRAKDLVRQYFADSGLDQAGFPLSDLVARRVDNGWLTYAPSPNGELIIGRALFYVADDGVVERSSSAHDPNEYAKEFARRYRGRHS